MSENDGWIYNKWKIDIEKKGSLSRFSRFQNAGDVCVVSGGSALGWEPRAKMETVACDLLAV